MFTLPAVSDWVQSSAPPKQEAERRNMSVTRFELSKGGVGMISTHLYVDLKSNSNELILKPTENTEERWKGKSASIPEVVMIFEGKAWSSEDLPRAFDLSRAVVVSFEADKVRFFDFAQGSGAYFDRIR